MLLYLTFETDRFNRTEAKDYYINPNCFGDDLAQWLVMQLEHRNIKVGNVGQEDWGWEVQCTFAGSSYFMSIGSVAGTEEDGNFGEWRIYLTRQCSLIGRIFGKDRMHREEGIIAVLYAILNDAKFANIQCGGEA